VTVEGGQSEIIQSSISSLSKDRRLQALLIAFCFSPFLEGVAGEGAPVAVAAAMLIGLGFTPLVAAVVCLVANTPPVPFGPVGVPTSMMISVTNTNGTAITKTIGSDMAILALVIPLLVLVVISGFKHTIEVWPAALVVGFSYAVICFPLLGSGTAGYHLRIRVDGMSHCSPETLEAKADLAVCLRFR